MAFDDPELFFPELYNGFEWQWMSQGNLKILTNVDEQTLDFLYYNLSELTRL